MEATIWTLRFRDDSDHALTSDANHPVMVEVLGILINALIFILSRILIQERDLAAKISHDMTREFHISGIRTRTIIDMVAESLVMFDSMGMIASANPTATETFGYESSALIRPNIKMLFSTPDHAKHDEQFG